ncbi:MAG: hypothetical protein PHT99_08675 [Methanoregula sp.]|nr:hypothetical protein [Methanoregula sp.]
MSRLPQCLVQRIGEEKVRELYGLNPSSAYAERRAVRSARSRRVKRFVESTKRTEFTASQVAWLLGDITPSEVSGVLRAMDTVIPTHHGATKAATWKKVEA